MSEHYPVSRSRSVQTALAGAFAALCLISSAPAFADRDSDDLLKAVKKARLIDLSHTWEIDSPVAGVNPPYDFALKDTHANTFNKFGDNGQLTYASEVMQFSGQHGAPTIDAIGHIARNGKLFGGADAVTSTSNPKGIGTNEPNHVGANLAIDQFPTDLMMNRGILLDVARFVRGDSSPLDVHIDGQKEITAELLERTAKHQRVKLKKGDTVFIRTGWGQYFNSNSAVYTGNDSPGPSVGGANFLINHGARVVGDDTLTFEMRPPVINGGTPQFQIFPVHMRIIADSGIYIIENLNLEELSEAKAYEFVVVVPPLKVLGGTGSALRAFALVPSDDDRH
ncbi:MAG TPA: cyclase family protein [Burkholderiales bacterium]|nr:cyclase family protein [Burkholderiales bacterium]